MSSIFRCLQAMIQFDTLRYTTDLHISENAPHLVSGQLAVAANVGVSLEGCQIFEKEHEMCYHNCLLERHPS